MPSTAPCRVGAPIDGRTSGLVRTRSRSAHSGQGSLAPTNAPTPGSTSSRDVAGRKLCQSHKEPRMTLSALRKEGADSLIGRPVGCGAEALQEGVGEAPGPDSGRWTALRSRAGGADGESLARDAARFDVRHHREVEGRREQLDPVMAGKKQVRDEVHAVIEVDPVGRGTSGAVAVAPVEASEQCVQCVHDYGLHIGWRERLARNGGHVLVEQQRSVGRLYCPEKLRHQFPPEIACGAHEGVESRGDRRRKPGKCPDSPRPDAPGRGQRPG